MAQVSKVLLLTAPNSDADVVNALLQRQKNAARGALPRPIVHIPSHKIKCGDRNIFIQAGTNSQHTSAKRATRQP